MRNLFRFLVRYNFLILFLSLETISLLFVLSNNPIQRSRFYARTNAISAIIYDKAFQVTQYIDLRRAADELAKENAYLRAVRPKLFPDTISHQNSFAFYPAQVINNSVNKAFNYITIDRGSDMGIEPDMAVVSPTGIVGVVKSVSPGYARIISVLNSQLRVSVRLRKSQYFGSLHWDTKNYREVVVSEIPSHVEVEIGDTIETSGYSAIFPAGEIAATVTEVERTVGGNFLQIRARLTNDFKRLSKVYVVKSVHRDEILGLETIKDEK